MGLTDFGIILDRPTKTYLSGPTYQKSTGEIKSPLSDVIKGQLVINLSSPINFQKIKIELVGSGTVKWTEERGTRSRNNYRIITYSNQETYVKKETVLHNGPSLPQGIHYLPFSFQLPPNMPNSFESDIGQVWYSEDWCGIRNIERDIGQVRYSVKAIIDRDHKVEQPLMVKSILDLNMHPSAKHEGNSRDHKRLCCFCCKSGPISAVIATNR